MAKKKASPSPSPWMTVTIGLVGLMIGYVVVIGPSGALASAGSYVCPAKQSL